MNKLIEPRWAIFCPWTGVTRYTVKYRWVARLITRVNKRLDYWETY